MKPIIDIIGRTSFFAGAILIINSENILYSLAVGFLVGLGVFLACLSSMIEETS